MTGLVWVIEEEAQHLRSGVRATMVRVRTFGASSEPCMCASMHDPVLRDNPPASCTMHAPSRRSSGAAADLLDVNGLRVCGGSGDDTFCIDRIHRRVCIA